MYLHQPGGPEVKYLYAVRPKCPLAGVKKVVIQQEKLHLGLAFCRAGTGTPRLIRQEKTGNGDRKGRGGSKQSSSNLRWWLPVVAVPWV